MRRFLIALSFLCVLKAGDKGPNLSLHDLAGNKVQLRSYRGKIVVLNFWATWCGPCREEMPMVGETAREWSPKGITFIAVSLDEAATRQKIPAFLDKCRSELPVWIGASGDTLDQFRLHDGIPDTVFFNEDGDVVFRVRGEIRHAELEERLEWLSSDRKTAPPPAFVNHM